MRLKELDRKLVCSGALGKKSKCMEDQGINFPVNLPPKESGHRDSHTPASSFIRHRCWCIFCCYTNLLVVKIRGGEHEQEKRYGPKTNREFLPEINPEFLNSWLASLDSQNVRGSGMYITTTLFSLLFRGGPRQNARYIFGNTPFNAKLTAERPPGIVFVGRVFKVPSKCKLTCSSPPFKNQLEKFNLHFGYFPSLKRVVIVYTCVYIFVCVCTYWCFICAFTYTYAFIFISLCLHAMQHITLIEPRYSHANEAIPTRARPSRQFRPLRGSSWKWTLPNEFCGISSTEECGACTFEMNCSSAN